MTSFFFCVGVNVVPMQRDHLWPAARLLRRAFSPSDAVGPLIVAEHYLQLAQRLHTSHALVALDERDERLVGYVELLMPDYLAGTMPDAPPDLAAKLLPVLSSLAVDESSRGAGVGTRLVQACEEHVRTCRVARRGVSLQVEEDNRVALRLYQEKLGYRIVRRERVKKLVGDVLFGSSIFVSRLTLEKSLDL